MFNFFRCGGNCDCCCRFCHSECSDEGYRPCGGNGESQGCCRVSCERRPSQSCCGRESCCGCEKSCCNRCPKPCGCESQRPCCPQQRCGCQRPCRPPEPPFRPCPPMPPIPPYPPVPPVPPLPPLPPVLTSPITVLVGGGAANGLTTTATGTTANAVYVGFGNSAVGEAFSSPVALPTATASLAFTLPAGGRLTSFSANYLPAATPVGLNDATVYAALMADFAGNGSFVLVPGSTVAVARGINSATAAGAPYSASKNVNAPVGAGTRLIVVYYLADNGATAAGTLIGYGNASYTIDPRMR